MAVQTGHGHAGLGSLLYPTKADMAGEADGTKRPVPRRSQTWQVEKMGLSVLYPASP